MCPYYLSIGMSYEDYWRGDAGAVRYYRKAEELRSKRRNFDAWLQGLYVYEAIGDMTPALHAFARKGTKPIPYPGEPYPLTEYDRDEKQREEEEAEKEKIAARLKAWANRVNARMPAEKTTNEREVTGNGAGTDRTDRY